MRVWINGEIVESEQAAISPFDRGFIFGDGVYETVQYFNRVGVGMATHIARLERSMSAIGMTGFEADGLETIGQTLLKEEGLTDAIYYLQVTRGVQIPRRHLPEPRLTPTVFAYLLPTGGLAEIDRPRSIRAATRPDERWHRCSIKGISLLGNLLPLLESRDEAVDEVILHRDGCVTEGTMTTVFAVVGEAVVTPPDDGRILPGVTRTLLIAEAAQAGYAVEERLLPMEELSGAEEIFLASSRRMLDAVVKLDDRSVGSGAVGPVGRDLFARLRQRVAADCQIALHSLA